MFIYPGNHSERMDVTRKRSIDEVKEILKSFLSDLGIQVVEEIDRPEYWGYWVRFGTFPLLIEHLRDSAFCTVGLQITIPKESEAEKLNALYTGGNTRAVYELTRAFSSPLTGFSRILEGGTVRGFAVSKLIFPFHPGFSIEDIDEALQAVVSTGAVGVAYLKIVLGDQEFDHRGRTPIPPVTGAPPPTSS